MKRDKIIEKIKELNSFRARLNRDFKEIKRKYDNHEISDKDFEKHESHFNKDHEKIRLQIHDLEHKLNKLKE